MEVSTPPSTSSSENESDTEKRAEDAWWLVLGRLYRWRRFIAGVTASVAVAAVIISLLLPNWYQASTRLLLPNDAGGAGMLGAVTEGLPDAAQSLLGGATGDYVRLLALLDSGSMFGSVAKHFDLVKVYDTGDSETPMGDALKQLRENTAFTVDEEYNYLSVKVMDKDPQRAAKMANYFVERLNHMNVRLSSENAGSYRQFIERRYDKIDAQLDSVLDATTAFQEKHGVMNLEKQAPAFFESAAQLRFNEIQAEIKYKQLRSQYGSGNSAVQAARQAMQAANESYENVLEGEDKLMPVAKKNMPAVTRKYIELEKKRRILTKILQYMRPLLEQARLDEERKQQAVQVVDKAHPPHEDAWPPRAIICIVATISAFMLAVLFALAYEWWRRRHEYFARRMRAVVERENEEVR